MLFLICLFVDVMLQLKVGNGEDFFPRGGRWNFNNKVLIFLCSFDCIWY